MIRKVLLAVAGILATPLKLGRKLRHRHPKSTWNDKYSKAAILKVYNECSFLISVYWINYEGVLQQYGTVRPGKIHSLNTFSTHPWRFKPSDGAAKPVWTYVGSSAVLRLQPGGKLQVKQLAAAEQQPQQEEDDGSWVKPEWGQYRQRGCVAGMPIMAYDCVCDEAVSALACGISNMTACCRPDIMERLVAAGCTLAVIGRGQVTTDIPAHYFLRCQAEEGGRDIDGTTRGLGATRCVPTASCGEENLIMTADDRYPAESILVHEFAHCVMNLGFSAEDTAAVHSLFEQAQRCKTYDDLECYMMDNADEYFAEASQAWFGATVRCDVNSGINTRDKLQQHDPGMFELLHKVYGDNSWCYTDTSPGVFTGQKPRAKAVNGSSSSSSSRPSEQVLVGASAGAGGQLPRAMLLHSQPGSALP